MTASLKLHYFAHSWISDWNHGNAHFLRGLARALQQLGHSVTCYEQLGAWSLSNLVQHEGEQAVDAIDQFRRAYPDLDVRFYNNDASFRPLVQEQLRGADVVIIHEWNDPEVVNAVLELKSQLGFRVLLHDTHHRAYTSPRDILRFRLDLFDGVLAFGEAIRRLYTDGFGLERAWTFHEAAATDVFHPREAEKCVDLLWIGNWGDEERTRELQEFLVEPVRELHPLSAVVYGVRYPEHARQVLADSGIEFRGYLPNLRAPHAYAESRVALHVPRRQYANGLSGIPTIRVFEALACGTPLLCSPWHDAEGLFRPGEDYVSVPNAAAMIGELECLLRDERARAQIAASGLKTIHAHHTCAHRAAQLTDICEELGK